MGYTAVSLATIQAALPALWENLPFWTPAEAGQRFNQALRFWNLLTGTWKRKEILPSAANAFYYTIPGTFTFGFRVSWRSRPLLPSSIWDLDHARPQWRLETIASGGSVPTEPECWAPVGLTQFAIWPADSAVANPLELDGIANTPVLPGTNPNTEFVDIDQAELRPLYDETIHLLALKLGGPLWRATLPRHYDFIVAAADKNSRLKANSYFRQYLGLDRARGDKPIRDVLDQALVSAVGSGSSPGGQ